MNHIFVVISGRTSIFISSTQFDLRLPLQVSEQEMDEAIARTTHRENKDASSSHITGSGVFSPSMCPFPDVGRFKDMH